MIEPLKHGPTKCGTCGGTWPCLAERVDAARRYHDLTDHAADGEPFNPETGSREGVCNCMRVAERWMRANPEVPRG